MIDWVLQTASSNVHSNSNWGGVQLSQSVSVLVYVILTDHHLQALRGLIRYYCSRHICRVSHYTSPMYVYVILNGQAICYTLFVLIIWSFVFSRLIWCAGCWCHSFSWYGIYHSAVYTGTWLGMSRLFRNNFENNRVGVELRIMRE